MKNLLFGLIVCCLIVLSCDKAKEILDIRDVPVSLKVDFDELVKLPPNSEASSAVNFGQPSNVPNSEYTSQARIGDKLIWQKDSTAAAEDEIVFDRIKWVSGDTTRIKGLLEFVDGLPVRWTNLARKEIQMNIVGAALSGDLDCKYDLWFYAERSGTRSGPYYIDPKIQIKKR